MSEVEARVLRLHEKAATIDAVAPRIETMRLSAGAGEILVAGPGLVPVQLMKHIESERPDIAKKVVGITALDHPSDGELVKFARNYFRRADRMTAQRPH